MLRLIDVSHVLVVKGADIILVKLGMTLHAQVSDTKVMPLDAFAFSECVLPHARVVCSNHGVISDTAVDTALPFGSSK